MLGCCELVRVHNFLATAGLVEYLKKGAKHLPQHKCAHGEPAHQVAHSQCLIKHRYLRMTTRTRIVIVAQGICLLPPASFVPSNVWPAAWAGIPATRAGGVAEAHWHLAPHHSQVGTQLDQIRAQSNFA